MKISAVLLVVWYCMSIIGFDVHTCKSSGNTFVAAFVETLSCEDIHPEHGCCSSGTCTHSEECCHEGNGCCNADHTDSDVTLCSDECCTDNYQVIQISGTRTDNMHDGKKLSVSGLEPALLTEVPASLLINKEHIEGSFGVPDSGVFMPSDFCVIFGIFRI